MDIIETQDYFKGSRIRLGKLSEDDIFRLIEIEEDITMPIMTTRGFPFPRSAEEVKEFYKKYTQIGNSYIFGIFNEDEILIGSVGVYNINSSNGTCEIGISLDKDFRNNGYGSEAIETVLKFIFNFINIHKVKLHVFEFNSIGIKCYENLGFVREGVLRQEIFRFGRFYDVYVYSILRDEYNEIYG